MFCDVNSRPFTDLGVNLPSCSLFAHSIQVQKPEPYHQPLAIQFNLAVKCLKIALDTICIV